MTNAMQHTDRPLRIIMAGGGTGGHIFPAIAIAQALQQLRPDTEVLFIGAKGKMEMEKVPQAGFQIKGLDIAGFNRSSLLKNIKLPYQLLKSFVQVRQIFSSFQPDAAIGVGGYSTYPVLRYAQSKGIPTFIHEANSFAGKSNQLLGKKATAIFVAIDGMEAFFPAHKIQVTGNPVRNNLRERATNREEALAYFGLKPTQKTVLSVGGSLGANSINEAIRQHIDLFAQHQLQLIWQTGKTFVEEGKKAAAGKLNIWVNDFISQMNLAYAAADVVISRSGAMSVAELCVQQKPTLFVPYPFAAEDHQTVNAKKLVNKQAAMMISDAEALTRLVPSIVELANNPTEQDIFKQNMAPLAINNADAIIAKAIMQHLRKG